MKPPDYFRLEQLQEEFNFCDDQDIANNKRFQLLELRDGEVADFKNFKMVPVLEKEIPRDTFTVSFCNIQVVITKYVLILSATFKNGDFKLPKSLNLYSIDFLGHRVQLT